MLSSGGFEGVSGGVFLMMVRSYAVDLTQSHRVAERKTGLELTSSVILRLCVSFGRVGQAFLPATWGLGSQECLPYRIKTINCVRPGWCGGGCCGDGGKLLDNLRQFVTGLVLMCSHSQLWVAKPRHTLKTGFL
jgi:hypothetical protein